MKLPFSWAGRRPGIIPVFFLFLSQAIAGQVNFPDARSLALGSCKVQNSEYISTITNPADLPSIKSLQFYSGHTRPFVDAGVGVSSLSVLIPASPGSFLFEYSHTGIRGFGQNWAGIGYGIKMADRLSGGIAFLFDHNYCNDQFLYLWSIGLRAGISFGIHENTRISIFMENPFTISNFKDYGPLIPGFCSLGLSHRFYESSFLLLEYEYRNVGRSIIRLGLEYRILEKIILRGGYHSSPFTLSLGSGIQIGRIILDFSEAWSINIGHTPAIGIVYIPKL